MNTFKKYPFTFLVAFSVIAFASFIQIDSAHADKYGLNAVYVVAGLVSSAIAVLALIEGLSNAGSKYERNQD